MRLRTKFAILTLLVLIFGGITLTQPVSAQAGTPSDLISTVNSLRQSLGLTPYTVDGYLMSFAQSHSDYMASIGTWTHTRADGSTAFDYGIKENVAMGTNMSIQYTVYTVWSDYVHWQTMTGFATGKVGAGVAVSGDNVFYTLNVLPGDSSASEVSADASEDDVTLLSQNQQPTAIPILPIVTSTPNPDGIIIHIVQYGENLWTISEAYGVPIDEILRNSGMSVTTTAVYEGDRLLIRAATEPSATPTFTRTPDPGTPTPTQPRPTMTPFPTRTPAPTFTPTTPPSILHRTLGEAKSLGIGLILVSGLGLILVIYTGFIKKP